MSSRNPSEQILFTRTLSSRRPEPIWNWLALLVLLSLGLEGLDVEGAGLDRLADPAAWSAGLSTSYARTVIISEIAFLSALAPR